MGRRVRGKVDGTFFKEEVEEEEKKEKKEREDWREGGRGEEKTEE